MKKVFGFLVLLAFLHGSADAHSGKPKYQVIIDTDGAIDDMRALSMFLSGNDIRVLAITCSRGTLLSDSAYVKVRSLLTGFHHEGIPVGISEKALKTLDRATESSKEKITLIALGSLSTYAGWIRDNPLAGGKIERILWYNSHEIEKGYNYSVDPESYEFIRQSGIPLEIISAGKGAYTIDKSYLQLIQTRASVYAKQIAKLQSETDRQLSLGDDLVPLYLSAPLLFEKVTENNIHFVSMEQIIPKELVFETIGELQ